MAVYSSSSVLLLYNIGWQYDSSLRHICTRCCCIVLPGPAVIEVGPNGAQWFRRVVKESGWCPVKQVLYRGGSFETRGIWTFPGPRSQYWDQKFFEAKASTQLSEFWELITSKLSSQTVHVYTPSTAICSVYYLIYSFSLAIPIGCRNDF